MFPFRGRSDRGETLIELVVGIAILGLAGVAVLAGMLLNIRVSTVHRNQAGGGAYVRSAAEAIQKAVDTSGTYASCADALDSAKEYTTAARSVFSPTDLSNGYAASVLRVQSWKGGSTGWGACDAVANAKGIQRIQLQVVTLGGSGRGAVETLYVILRKPCSGSASTVGADPCA